VAELFGLPDKNRRAYLTKKDSRERVFLGIYENHEGKTSRQQSFMESALN
jgi:hypothetical protein